MSRQPADWRGPRIRYRFKREELEFMFQFLAGTIAHGGAELGEVFYAASTISEKNERSWIQAWEAMAARVRKRADDSAARGHVVSARASYLRAYTYQRAPLIFISPLMNPGGYAACYRKAQDSFRRAAALFDPPVEALSIPYEGHVLPGYFLKAAGGTVPRKTLLMIGGGDTFVEDLYFYVGPAAVARGYNVLLVDLPGQGILPFDGLTWPAEAEKPVAEVVGYALSRSDVDPARLVAYGLSGGGYLVPRSLTRETRIAAAAACCLVVDMSRVWSEPLVDLYRNAERLRPYRLVLAAMRHRRPTLFTMLDTYLWRFGATSVARLPEVTHTSTLDPAEITCPLLNVVSEQEYRRGGIQRISADLAQQRLPHPRSGLVVTPQDEGADGHGVGTNLSLMSQLVFDWFDETLEAIT